MKKKSPKQLKMGQEIKKIISDIFLRQNLLLINNNIITILECDVSPDVKSAIIYIDVFTNNQNEEKNGEKITTYFNKLAPNFRYELAQRLKCRLTPEIKFILDKTEKYAASLESLIEKESQAFTKK